MDYYERWLIDRIKQSTLSLEDWKEILSGNNEAMFILDKLEKENNGNL